MHKMGVDASVAHEGQKKHRHHRQNANCPDHPEHQCFGHGTTPLIGTNSSVSFCAESLRLRHLFIDLQASAPGARRQTLTRVLIHWKLDGSIGHRAARPYRLAWRCWVVRAYYFSRCRPDAQASNLSQAIQKLKRPALWRALSKMSWRINAWRTGSSGELCAYRTSYVPQRGCRGSGSLRP